jgi:SAM-dependent methyltransferase
MSDPRMQEFWDARAREDAYFYVDTRRALGDAELESFWAGGEKDVDTILQLLGVEVAADDVALDIGCGVGRLSRVLAGRAREVYALDVSEEMLARAREHHSALTNVHWVHGDGTSLGGVADASIDACLSHVVFQHIPDPEITYGYVREMGRVLKPGGWAAFQVSNDPGIHAPRDTKVPLRRRIVGLRGAPQPQPQGQNDPEWRGSAVDLERLRAAADEGGLDLTRVVGEGTQYCLVLATHR